MKLSHMWILSAFLVCAFGSAARAQTAVVRVDGDVDEADPSGQGGAWGEDNAYKFLQDALSQAELLLGNPEIEEVQIWVKATARDNPYLPDRDMVDEEGSCEGDPVVICDQESSFELRSSVHVYGGFDGTETEADERSPIANETFLSGDLDGGDAGFPSLGLDNAHHVVLAEAVDSSARIDGFTITLGQADGAELGGGMLITDADPVVLRCNFEANYARFGGGGAHVDGAASEAYFSNCVFRRNKAPGVGAGEGVAGGLCNIQGSAELVNCLFYENEANITGGAIRIQGTETNPVSLVLVNCTIADNLSTYSPGSCPGPPQEAGGAGGISAQEYGTLTIVNSIVWGNESDSTCYLTDEHAQIQIGEDVTYSITYTCIEGLDEFGDEGNIASNPGLAATYRLKSGSPALDAGLNSEIEDYEDVFDLDADDDDEEPTPDLDTGNRIRGDDVDMGAFERYAPCPGDVNDDQTVDVLDLLEVTGNWGDPYAISDLLDVLGNWGPCNYAGTLAAPSSILDCLQKYSDPAERTACIEAVILAGTP